MHACVFRVCLDPVDAVYALENRSFAFLYDESLRLRTFHPYRCKELANALILRITIRSRACDHSLYFCNGTAEPFQVVRLEEVVECVHFERTERVLIERRHEHDRGKNFRVERANYVEPGAFRHLDVEKHHIGLQRLDLRDRVRAITRLAENRHAPDLREHGTQQVACERLVVN